MSPDASEWNNNDDPALGESTQNTLNNWGPMGRLYLELNRPTKPTLSLAQSLQERKCPVYHFLDAPVLRMMQLAIKRILEFYGSPIEASLLLRYRCQ
jgi:hypothetical protein